MNTHHSLPLREWRGPEPVWMPARKPSLLLTLVQFAPVAAAIVVVCAWVVRTYG